MNKLSAKSVARLHLHRYTGPNWRGRNIVPIKVQVHMKGVNQVVGLQLVYETGQRPENQITKFGLVPRQKV